MQHIYTYTCTRDLPWHTTAILPYKNLYFSYCCYILAMRISRRHHHRRRYHRLAANARSLSQCWFLFEQFIRFCCYYHYMDIYFLCVILCVFFCCILIFIHLTITHCFPLEINVFVSHFYVISRSRKKHAVSFFFLFGFCGCFA